MTDNWHTTLRPCPDPTCDRGLNTYAVRSHGGRWTGEEETRDCETCGGEGAVAVEVHEACGSDLSLCRCFDEVEEAKVA